MENTYYDHDGRLVIKGRLPAFTCTPTDSEDHVSPGISGDLPTVYHDPVANPFDLESKGP